MMKCPRCKEGDVLSNVSYTDKNNNKVEVQLCDYCIIEDDAVREGFCGKCSQLKPIFYWSTDKPNEWRCTNCIENEMKNTVYVFKDSDGKFPTEMFICETCGAGYKNPFCIRCGKVIETIWVSQFSEKFSKIKDKFKSVEDTDERFSLIAKELKDNLLNSLSGLIDKAAIEQHLTYQFRENWQSLLTSSKTYLTTGKFLYVALSQMPDGFDFSPVVIEYSKALEKELYEKIFIAYRQKVTGKSSTNTEFEDFLKGKRDLTLGQMSYILNSIQSYPELNNFLEGEFVNYNSYFYYYNFPKKLEKFIYKFRNKSAHIEPLTKQDCEECESYLFEEPIKLLIYFLQNLRSSAG